MTIALTEASEMRQGSRSRFKRIVISERNYMALKRLGYAGDSFNDQISKLLRIERHYQEIIKQQEEEQQHQEENNDDSSRPTFSSNPSETFDEPNKQQIAEFIRRLQ